MEAGTEARRYYYRMHSYPTALLSDAAGRAVALDERIRPLWPGARLIGTAFTVRTPPGEHFSVRQAALTAGRGDVVVVDGGGCTDAALWGDILAQVGLARGLSGLVVDGAVRDAEEIERLGFPVFAAAVVPAGPRGKETPGEIGVRITCGGIGVDPGDYVFGDRDGVVVIPRTDLDEVMMRAKAREESEAEMLRELLKQGKPPGTGDAAWTGRCGTDEPSARVDHQ